MIRISVEHASVSGFGGVVLDDVSEMLPPLKWGIDIFLLFMDMTNLKPYIFFR
jgi:hypothetical protein